MATLALAASLAGVAGGLAVYALLGIVFSEQSQVQRRLRGMSAYETTQALEAQPLLQPFGERIVRPLARRLSETVQSLGPSDYKERLRERVMLAGDPGGMDVGRFMSAKILLGFGSLVLFVVVAFIMSLAPLSWLLFGIPLVALGFFAPDLWLRSRIEERQKAIRRALPDMLDMLNISVEAGLGFDAALAKIVKASAGPLSQEFARTLKEIQSGLSRGDALRSLARRTQVPELSSFIMAIVQAEQFGISVSTVLRTQAKEMRLKRRQLAEEQAQKLPVKIVFPLVLCILPATMIVILGPAVVSIGGAMGFIN